MDSQGSDVKPVSMDVELTRIPKRKECLNLMTGVFLRSVYFLAGDLSKCAIVGIFKNRGDALGIAFNGKKTCVFWSYNVLNQFAIYFNDITASLETKTKQYFKLDTNEDIRVRNLFGKMHVLLYDGERTLALNAAEWTQFVNNLALVNTSLRDLFINEDLIQNYVRDLVVNEGEIPPPPEGLPEIYINRLADEVSLYKRWPNGGGC